MPEQFESFTATEFNKFCEQQYNRIELLEEKADIRAGLICSIIANCNRGKNGKTYKVSDFVKIKHKHKKKQTPEEMAAQCRWITKAFDGEVVV